MRRVRILALEIEPNSFIKTPSASGAFFILLLHIGSSDLIIKSSSMAIPLGWDKHARSSPEEPTLFPASCAGELEW
jgi:hypothetical protein